MISFFFNTTSRDFCLAKRLSSQIQLHHPDSSCLVITDGFVEGSKELLENNKNLILVEGERLKKPGNIGKFTTRNFSTILSLTESCFIVKLDPDSFLRKPILHVPKKVDWAGSIKSKKTKWGVCSWCNGGGWIMKREAMEKILLSNQLLNEEFTESQPFETNRQYEDWRLGVIANLLGIFPKTWGAVRNINQNYKEASIVHPVKTSSLPYRRFRRRARVY